MDRGRPPPARAGGRARVDRKTLYRLASTGPVGKADIATIRRVCDVLGVGLDEFWELPLDKVRRLNELGQQNNAGTLGPDERYELGDLVLEYQALAAHNAQVRLWRNEPSRFEQARPVASST